MKVKRITDIDTALYIYYRYPEIGNKEIKELFGGTDKVQKSRTGRADKAKCQDITAIYDQYRSGI